MPRAPFLGEVKLFWCEYCNVPLLSSKCSKCGREGVGNGIIKVPITPPGDVRPAFECDLKLIRSIVNRDYGSRVGDRVVPGDKIVLLNRAPDIDRMDEVIIDGKVIGMIRYDLKRQNWEFLPKISGARRLYMYGARKWIKIDKGAADAILNGLNLLIPGIVDLDQNIKREDNVIIVNERSEVIATGRSKISARELKYLEKGLAVKVREASPPVNERINPGGQTWHDVLEANSEFLEKEEQKSISLIRKVVRKYKKDVTVAFSGGKDSLATLLLAMKALDTSFKILYVDTGIEFPETVKYSEKIFDLLGVKRNVLRKHVSENVFWNLTEKFGPPGRDFRFCCKTNKLGPIAQLISSHFKNGCITLIGVRRYESERRARDASIWENPWVPNQIAFSPIRNWTALHVWLYIFREGLPYNPLYEFGFTRLGCWLCPAMRLGDISIIRASHKDLWEKWETFLVNWADKHDLNSDWLKYGLWRWKNPPESLLRSLSISDISKLKSKSSKRTPLSCTVIIGPEGCNRDIFSANGITSPGNIDLRILSVYLTPLGHVYLSNKLNVIRLLAKDGSLTCYIYEDGSFKVISRKQMTMDVFAKKVRSFVKQLLLTILRAKNCTKCGICSSKCPEKAITIFNGKFMINSNLCKHCGLCIQNCPVNLLQDNLLVSFVQ
ncbi:MAG: phosphoadenosine phosphosulfate reductase domain-containing protein [Candidatus Baldrarchaeia archaeon]